MENLNWGEMKYILKGKRVESRNVYARFQGLPLGLNPTTTVHSQKATLFNLADCVWWLSYYQANVNGEWQISFRHTTPEAQS